MIFVYILDFFCVCHTWQIFCEICDRVHDPVVWYLIQSCYFLIRLYHAFYTLNVTYDILLSKHVWQILFVKIWSYTCSEITQINIARRRHWCRNFCVPTQHCRLLLYWFYIYFSWYSLTDTKYTCLRPDTRLITKPSWYSLK